MKTLRRNLIIIFVALVFALSFFAAENAAFLVVSADTTDNYDVQTDIVTPRSYLEYRTLSAPLDVAVSDDYFIIAESNRLTVYHENAFSYYDLPAEYNLSKIALYGDYCLFLSTSSLYVMDLTSGDVSETDVNVANYFSVYGDTLVTNPSNSIYKYTIVSSDDGLTFDRLTSYRSLETDAQKITVISGDKIYFFNERKIFPFDFTSYVGVRITENLDQIRYTATDGENLYFTSEFGVYKVVPSKGVVERMVACQKEEALYNLVNPQGACYFDGYLFVADSRLNCVYKIDLSTGSMTDFAVTDRGDGANRINSPSDVCVDGNVVYVLESDEIKAYDTKNDTYSSYSLDGFNGAKIFDFADNLALLCDSSNLFLLKLSESGLSSVTINSDTVNFKNVTAVASYENDFYFINNESINLAMTARIYKLSTSDMKITPVASIEGLGVDLTFDIFGNAFACVYSYQSSTYLTYKLSAATFAFDQPIFSVSEKPSAIFTDVEDGVFMLINGAITAYSQVSDGYEQTARFDLSISENLPDDIQVKDLALIDGDNKVYFLTDVALLTCDKDSALGMMIKTPSKLPVPETYSIDLNETVTVCTVNDGAKLFKIDLPSVGADGKATTEYFDYLDFKTNVGSRDYLLVAENERYLIVTDGVESAIVRRSDASLNLLEKSIPTTREAFAVDNYGLYAYPVVNDYFKCGAVTENQRLTIEYSVTVNGLRLYMATDGENKGYLPASLVKPAVATDNSPVEYYTIKIGKSGAKVYSDKKLTEQIGSIDGETTVYAIRQEDKVILIKFGEGEGYINSDDAKPSTYYSVRNIIVISALFVGLFVTVVYLIRNKVFKRKED